MPNRPTKKYLRALTDACDHLRDTGDVEPTPADLAAPAGRPPTKRTAPTPARAAATFARDGYCCRYCGAKVVPAAVLRAASLVWPDAIPSEPRGTSGNHPLFATSAAVLDVVDPDADDGEDAEMVTACVGCHAQKGELTLDRLGWELRKPKVNGWDGLVSSYELLLLHRHERVLTAGDRAFHARWLRAFDLDADVLKRAEALVDSTA